MLRNRPKQTSRTSSLSAQRVHFLSPWRGVWWTLGIAISVPVDLTGPHRTSPDSGELTRSSERVTAFCHVVGLTFAAKWLNSQPPHELCSHL